MKLEQKNTPLMKQYFSIKEQYPDCLLLFQVGDFYELFYEDAQKAAQFLGITLTARGRNNGDPIPLCGVPVHAITHYLRKLIKGGFRVALCDQLQEAIPGKVVERGVTQVFTPGTLTDTNLLDAKTASYVCSFYPSQDYVGLLFAELLTAQIFATVVPQRSDKIIEVELLRFMPDEILLPHAMREKSFSSLFTELGFCITPLASDVGHEKITDDWLQRQFKQDSLDILRSSNALHQAIQLLFIYFQKNHEIALEQFRQVHFYKTDDYLLIDPASQRNLELTTNSEGTRSNTLFSIMDKAGTAAGSRVIKKWIARPLLKKDVILQRQDVVAQFKKDFFILNELRRKLTDVGDFERIIGRIALKRAGILDYLALITALKIIPELKAMLEPYTHIFLINLIYQSLPDFSALQDLLIAALNTDNSRDYIINSGFDQRLDYVRQLIDESNTLILQLERDEQTATGIASLKIRYNQVHGYYIEITKTNVHLVPGRYIRHQTLIGKERFTTPELKKLEAEIITARNEIEQLEQSLFDRVKIEIQQYISPLRKTSQALAHLDALLSFAQIAYERNYCRPALSEENQLLIKEGKHPVVEQKLLNKFMSNDIHLNDSTKLWIITGPNMGGKSTFLRQTALIAIMAQCGSFVPAGNAQLPIIDKIFTRIGASDNVAEGKSTFFVEMEETALICAQATDKSLVILDEIGRGTSTFDGLAIAQAVVEFMHQQVKAYCLFATHYHELTQLPQHFPGIANYHAASQKTGKGIIFLYKILPGIAQGSLGIEVAKLAQLPKTVIDRAEQLLHEFNMASNNQNILQNSMKTDTAESDALNKLILPLKNIDYENLSPKQAFDLLWQFKEKMNEL